MLQLTINLDPNGVAAPARRAAVTAAHVVAACLDALGEDGLGEAELQGHTMGYRFTGPEMSSDERRITYQNWLLAKAFQDLARGIRESLEEACLYLTFVNRPPETTTVGQLENELADIRRCASKLHFPSLLARVNSDLLEPMAFDTEFLSIQKVRNCLEHRGGIVGLRDVEAGDVALTLSFPRLKIFYHRAGDEIELAPGEVIDSHDQQTEVPILARRVTRSKSYGLGERITFTAADFSEIAMACHFFAGDLGRKLPTVPTAAE